MSSYALNCGVVGYGDAMVQKPIFNLFKFSTRKTADIVKGTGASLSQVIIFDSFFTT